MARYMLDTNIFAYLADEKDRLTRDVFAILDDVSNMLYMSSESVKELVVAFKNKGLLAKRWKTVREMIDAIDEEYGITVLPVDVPIVKRMAELESNTAESHNDPSDLIIIAHSMVMKMPLISSDRKFPFYRNQGLDLITNFAE